MRFLVLIDLIRFREGFGVKIGSIESEKLARVSITEIIIDNGQVCTFSVISTELKTFNFVFIIFFHESF